MHLCSSEILAYNFFIQFILKPTPVNLSLSHPTRLVRVANGAILPNPVINFRSSSYWTYFDPVDNCFFLLSTSFPWIWATVPSLSLFLWCAPHLLSWHLLISSGLNMGVWGLRPYNIFLACLSLLNSRIMALNFLSLCLWLPVCISSLNIFPRSQICIYQLTVSLVYFIDNSVLSANTQDREPCLKNSWGCNEQNPDYAYRTNDPIS